MGTHREADLSLKRVKTLLNDKGYQEVITYSFVDPKVQQLDPRRGRGADPAKPDLQRNVCDAPVAVDRPAGHRGLQPEPSAEPGAHL